MKHVHISEVLEPRKVSVAEKIDVLLADRPHMAAVVLAPDGDNSMKMFYRGTGGAWWRADYNSPGVTAPLEAHLRLYDQVVLVTRDDVDDELNVEVEDDL